MHRPLLICLVQKVGAKGRCSSASTAFTLAAARSTHISRNNHTEVRMHENESGLDSPISSYTKNQPSIVMDEI